MLHIGLERVVRRRDILMILDAQKPMQDDTIRFLLQIEQAGRRIFCEKCKSIVIAMQEGVVVALESPISTVTLCRRGSVYSPQE